MKKKLNWLIGLSLTLISALASAHPGHDHGQWSSGSIHALWIAGTLVTAFVLVISIKKFVKAADKPS